MWRNMRKTEFEMAGVARFADAARKWAALNVTGAVKSLVLGAGVCIGLGAGVAAQAQGIKPPEPVKYDNKYEVFGGLNLDTGYAGRYLQKRMNFGGAEFLGTYWATRRIGLGLDYRGEAGTTPVEPGPGLVDRPVVYENMLLAGAQVRGPKNPHFALNYHAYFGAVHGVFDAGTGGYNPAVFGLYTNRTKPAGAVGISIDFNRNSRWAVRISPDMMLTDFGGEVDENFAMSGGIVYRFGRK